MAVTAPAASAVTVSRCTGVEWRVTLTCSPGEKPGELSVTEPPAASVLALTVGRAPSATQVEKLLVWPASARVPTLVSRSVLVSSRPLPAGRGARILKSVPSPMGNMADPSGVSDGVAAEHDATL